MAENNGIQIINTDASTLPRKTIIVLGTARGGTSMVAGILSRLGVFMGEEDSLSPFYEHKAFARLIKLNDKDSARALAREYDSRYQVWGIKTLAPRLWTWLKLFNEPVYILVFRDPIATANRRVVSMGNSIFPETVKVITKQLFMLAFIRISKRPAILISYEKTLISPQETVTALGAFLGINNSKLFDSASQFIQPSPEAYKRRATTTAEMDNKQEWFGYVDFVEKNRVVGWVASARTKEEQSVELKINGVFRQVVLSNLPRPDVVESDNRLNLNCGFEFRLANSEILEKNDSIEVSLHSDDHLPLANSPVVF